MRAVPSLPRLSGGAAPTAPPAPAPVEIPAWVNHAEGRYYCEICDDTSWVRRIKHPDNEQPRARKCACVHTNPVLLLRVQQERRLRGL